MPLFTYKAINALGETEEGLRDAPDEGKLIAALQAENYIPIKVALANSGSFLGLWGAKPNKLTQKDILLFTGELATLLESGLPIDKSLIVLMDLTEDNERLTKLIAKVLEKVKGGTSLADALEMQAGIFTKFYLNMIRAGEAGGGLGEVLNRLGEYLESSQELKDTVSTALIYPTILLVMSLASVFIMLTFVVPQFTEMFESAGKDLPISTQIVVGMAEWLKSYWWALFGAFFGVSSYMKFQLADPVRKKVWDGRFLRLPLFGSVLMNKETANITRTLGTLLGNGVSIIAAMVIVRETVDNLVIAEAIGDTEEQLKQGRHLSEALQEKALFPKMAMQMIKMGEETGRLEEMLLRVATIYDKQLRVAIQRMLAFLEPALIITLGLMIAGIIVSILLAILSVNDLAF
ncbi:type II secretion system F family protein [Methylovulum psychrotolerans]|jgi:general secretion pathway protein F|uniref:General secretion pathway protein GspF n=1 Tax=Methylovulum psychrotolerans TaxID=1704499 RepID=A0A1Z4BV91_9GAMM|nr:type II secretion system F family protein [Methylovulum psychrotolerans]ASF45188.1 general secretion pathway protein GspF [Methylovulum psychrotolerans]MBT9097414.1 type II secretion system F family protein [Methylovulum psychrotolerans]POZ53525.1 type II secretion system F family protein [Methylovulum psychrotolerans]